MKRFLFYFLNLTWGLPLNIVGFIVALVLLCAGKKPKRWGDCFYFKVGENWGGFEMGIFFLTDNTPSVTCRNHEHGHAIQNCFFGVFMPFIVNIPSAIRYWYRRIREKKGLVNETAYSDIWFEKQADILGKKYIKTLG